MARSPIFRQAALDRLASPEQLDLLLQVTTPKGWLALGALGLLLVSALTWSILGRIPTRVGGMGILVKKGGLQSVGALAAGQLVETFVRAGDMVAPEQVLARLALPELVAERESAQANLTALEAQNRRLSSFGAEDTQLQADAIGEQRRVAERVIVAAREREATLKTRLAAQEKLLADGLLTAHAVMSTRDAVSAAQAEVQRSQAQLKELTVRAAENRQRVWQEGGDRQKRIEEVRRGIAQLDDKIRLNAIVKSPSAGRVIEVRAAVGSLVTPGTPIVLIERTGAAEDTGLEAIVYVPATEGKKIQPGMSVDLSPSTVKREEYGAIRATVTTVSAFPSTQQAMLANLGNQELVAAFAKQIATPIELRVALRRNPRSSSGYAWTSPGGPPEAVQPGTLCTTLITVREQAPISFVVPIARKSVGL